MFGDFEALLGAVGGLALGRLKALLTCALGAAAQNDGETGDTDDHDGETFYAGKRRAALATGIDGPESDGLATIASTCGWLS